MLLSRFEQMGMPGSYIFWVLALSLIIQFIILQITGHHFD